MCHGDNGKPVLSVKKSLQQGSGHLKDVIFGNLNVKRVKC
jgi:hypothetical protein